MEGGGYDLNFVEEVPDYLNCIVCHLVLKDPLLFVDCGHRLCSGCFTEMQMHAVDRDTDVLCPHDRITIDTSKVFEDKGIARVIQDLKVRCNHFEKGCTWVGELRDLKAHVDEKCSEADKKNSRQLLSEVLKRIEKCEEQLREKDKEIIQLKKFKNFSIPLREWDNESDVLKRLARCEQKLQDKDIQIQQLQKELKETRDEVKQLKTTKSVPIEHDDLIEDIKVQTLDLQRHVLNVDEYIPGERTVFIWEFQNYSSSKDAGCDFSGPFYCETLGHFCKLSLKWFGRRLGRLGVFLHNCRETHGGWSSEFDMGITFEACDVNGEERTVVFTSDEVREGDDLFDISPGEDISDGFGEENFLNMPALKNFIIDDTLTITCTLTHTPSEP